MSCSPSEFVASIIAETNYSFYDWSVNTLGMPVESFVDFKVAFANSIFEQVNIRHVVQHYAVHPTPESDPFQQVTNFDQFSDKMRELWSSTMQEEPIAFAILLSGVTTYEPSNSEVIGRADENGVGRPSSSYAWAQSFSPLGSVVFTHEIGHLWGAGHCNRSKDDGTGIFDEPIVCDICGGNSVMNSTANSSARSFEECTLQEMRVGLTQGVNFGVLAESQFESVVLSTPSGPVAPGEPIELPGVVVEQASMAEITIANTGVCDLQILGLDVESRVGGASFTIDTTGPIELPAQGSVRIRVTGESLWPRTAKGILTLRVLNAQSTVILSREVPIQFEVSAGDDVPGLFVLDDLRILPAVGHLEAAGPPARDGDRSSGPSGPIDPDAEAPFERSALVVEWSHAFAAERYRVTIAPAVYSLASGSWEPLLPDIGSELVQIHEVEFRDIYRGDICKFPGPGFYVVSVTAFNENGHRGATNARILSLLPPSDPNPCDARIVALVDAEVVPSSGELADIDGDGKIDSLDLRAVIDALGAIGDVATDLNRDGVTSSLDVLELLRVIGDDS